MSTPFQYENVASRLDIKPSVDQKDVFLWVHEGRNQAAIHIPKTDAPTVAAELLKAAGQEGVFVPKPTDAVTELEDGSLRCGATDMAAHAWVEGMRHRAAELIAIADYVESKAQRGTEAEKKLQERREEVATRFGYEYGFGNLPEKAPLRRAIDRIIELEDARD